MVNDYCAFVHFDRFDIPALFSRFTVGLPFLHARITTFNHFYEKQGLRAGVGPNSETG